MSLSLIDRFKNALNAFNAKQVSPKDDYGGYSYRRPDRRRVSVGKERTIITSIYNRISLDVASIDIRHVRLDENNRYIEVIDSDLNNCFTLEANIDQTSRAFVQDVVMSMLDEGVIAIVPIDYYRRPDGSINRIITMRVGKIVSWHPTYVEVEVYNERTGKKEKINSLKANTAIIENPFYSVMNEPNGTLQRLIRKLNLLDAVDEQSSSGKLDLIVQLPYVIKSEARRKQAQDRRTELEKQLSGSKYGIAYTDSTEHITQLNRPIENNLMSQIEYLTNLLYSQLGITQAVMDGTADEKTMLNYENRSIEPILTAIVLECKRKFLTPTARTQGQSIEFFRSAFRLVPISNLAELADKFTRNEIMSPNEFRQVLGLKPSDDPRSDELDNRNMPMEDFPPENQNEGIPPEEGYNYPYDDANYEEPPEQQGGY